MSGSLAVKLIEISAALRSEAAIAARPGQMSRLEALADELRSLAGVVEGGEQDG